MSADEQDAPVSGEGHALDWSVRPTACSCGGFKAAGGKTFTLERFAVHLADRLAAEQETNTHLRRGYERQKAIAEDFEGRYETSHDSRMYAEECFRRAVDARNAATARAESAEAALATALREKAEDRARVEAVKADLSARTDHISALSNEAASRTDAYRLAGKAEGLRIAHNLVRAALAIPTATGDGS